MAAVVFRLLLLATGLGVTEIGLTWAIADSSPGGWALALVIGLPLVIAGSAGFMVNLIGGGMQKGPDSDG